MAKTVKTVVWGLNNTATGMIMLAFDKYKENELHRGIEREGQKPRLCVFLI